MMISSFGPIVGENPKVLILGTMPGHQSLHKSQYYAHPQNVFWKIIFQIFQKKYSDDYSERLNLILLNKIALWDVLRNCDRIGSLDLSIKNESPNDIKQFLQSNTSIKLLAFNGQSAFKYYKKYNSPNLINTEILVLPSSSPAHASKSFEEKSNAWSAILPYL